MLSIILKMVDGYFPTKHQQTSFCNREVCVYCDVAREILPSSRMLNSAGWLRTDVSVLPIGHNFKGRMSWSLDS